MLKPIMGVAGTAMLLACCLLAGSAGAQQSAAPAQATPTSPDPASVVVATVDGEKITLAELLSVKASLPEQYRDAPLEMLYVNLLDQIVERRIIAHAAVAKGLEQDPEVKLQIARARENVLVESYVTGEISPMLTDEIMRARYEKEIVAGGGDDEVHARHILVKTEADAIKIHDQILAGADFSEVAKQYSTGPSGPKGGDLGFFRKQDMVPEFSEAAFALKVGEVSAPVKTQFGWHIIKVEERRSAPPPAYEEVADKLRQEAAREAVTTLVADLRAKSKVEMFNADGSPIVMPQVIRPQQ